MNKMYEYLKEHAYVSENKNSDYQFELSEERAECIANKYNSLTEELQQENKQLQEELEEYKNPIKYFKYANKNVTEENQQLKDNWNKLKDYIKTEIPEDVFIDTEWFVSILDKMQELEQGEE